MYLTRTHPNSSDSIYQSLKPLPKACGLTTPGQQMMQCIYVIFKFKRKS
ncbi:MAG: hypothetical protein CM1200mP29_17630 [Verrucomicrobiota bacterium]|nr:MAG: hypothetical protein CM1200mP29_17630 [Verrucomicrobiota bacterium]